jgi:arylformamidase
MIYDITPPVTPRLAVWPGDTPPSREVLCDIVQGANITLSTLRATVHLGAHADGPNHYGKDAPGIDVRGLDYYLGPCQIVRVDAKRGQRVNLPELDVKTERLLLATGTFPDPENFNTDFAAYDPAFIDRLHRQGVKLIGIDTPSIDLFDSKDLPSHHAVLRHDMAILEGLVLRDVPAGVYELIALPLKLVGFDASPVRAILRKM